MHLFAGRLIRDINTLSLVVFLVTLALIVFALARRASHKSYYRRLDQFRRDCLPILEAIQAGRISYDTGISELKVRCGSGGGIMLERIMAGTISNSHEVPLFRQIASDIGLVRRWQEGLAMRGLGKAKSDLIRPRSGWNWLPRWPDFPNRAKAAEYLGLFRHQPSWRLMVWALHDPNADVRTAAVRALGALGEARAFPVLLKELRDATESTSPQCSIPTLRLALSRFPLYLASQISSFLIDPNPEVRFLGAEVIQEMVKHAAGLGEFRLTSDKFPGAVLDIFIDNLSRDSKPSVRARAAIVLGYAADLRAKDALINLLKDTEWFVRLQAVKSAGRGGVEGIEHQIAGRLSDPDWRVREAAAHALGSCARSGVEVLLNHFFKTNDTYMREQIAEELGRTGLINRWLPHFGETGFESESRALTQLADMGKTAFLTDQIAKQKDGQERSRLAASQGLHSLRQEQGSNEPRP